MTEMITIVLKFLMEVILSMMRGVIPTRKTPLVAWKIEDKFDQSTVTSEVISYLEQCRKSNLRLENTLPGANLNLLREA